MSAARGQLAVIAGAGLAGALLAVYLARAGWRVHLLERRSDPRAHGYAGGRSINLALSARGFDGLAGVGLDEEVRRRDAIPMRGRMIHPPPAPASPGHALPLVFQPYSSNPGDAINSVSRGGLNLTLIEAAAREPGVTISFDRRCIDADAHPSSRPAGVFARPDGGTERVEGDLLIGADGAFSAVRLRMMQTDRFEYSQTYLQHGYKELHIPPAPGGGHALDPHALHIWPRGGSMMIALPNRDGSFTCTLFWPFEGAHGFAGVQADDAARVRTFFEQHYPDAVPLMPTLAHDYAANPVGSLVTVRCAPWQLFGRVALVGDAAHAIVPFYGQGMNAAFEDCKCLAACLKADPRDPAGALAEYQRLRKPNADAIADMALENFVEMRDKTAQPEFRHRKRIEQTLHRLFPDRVHPQYNLVSFSTVPYVEAQRAGRELDAVLSRLAERLPAATAGALSGEAWDRAVGEAAARDPLFVGAPRA